MQGKTQWGEQNGFTPIWMPDFLFPFQSFLVEWALHKGRGAILADCGLGKSIQELIWAENVVRHTNKNVLILNPLAVSYQTVREGEKFGVEAKQSRDGKPHRGITVTNYEKLHLFDWQDFCGVVADESSILKNFSGKYRAEITEFMRKLPYRLLGTATAAPNDYIELGTSSEALGELGYTDMLTRFFKNDQHTIKPTVYRHRGQDFSKLEERNKWRFKGHAEIPFWRWVSSWARAIRKPSDLGFDDDGFILPPLTEHEHLIIAESLPDGMLFALPAVGLSEQREERRRTIQERCEKAAELVYGTGEQALMWCHLNDEGDLLEEIVKGAVQVSGSDEDEEKEEKFLAFAKGQISRLVTKPKIGAWGLNWQQCSHVTTFPSHSWESYYQSIRRCWRFGQKRPVRVDVITSEGEQGVLKNLQRKAKAADRMFTALYAEMNRAMHIERGTTFEEKESLPAWL